jgi:lysosomal acid lipase/cholesteryl ester hydrolase
MPSMVGAVLDTTGYRKLIYIGFSQGGSQMLAAMSINTKLMNKIQLFIALAPTTKIGAMNRRLTEALTHVSPLLLFPLFGRTAMLASTPFWKRVLTKYSYIRIIDISMRLIFGWRSRQITPASKYFLYSHLYSHTSVKAVIHWFQIVRNRRFAMFDETEETIGKDEKSQCFPLSQITAPIAIFQGSADQLPDINFLLSQLPNVVYLKYIPAYEHLDLIWGEDANKLLFHDILELVRKPENTPKPPRTTKKAHHCKNTAASREQGQGATQPAHHNYQHHALAKSTMNGHAHTDNINHVEQDACHFTNDTRL